MPTHPFLRKLAGAIVGLGCLAGLSTAASAAETIKLMTWGGHWLDIFRPVVEKFEKETGIKVEFVVQSGSSDGLNKLIAQRANPQVDVWTSIQSTVQSATKAELLVELDPAKIPNMKSVEDSLITPTGVAIWLSPRGIFYRKDLAPFEVKTWEDLWDPRLKGKLGTSFKLDRGSFLIMAALLNGGDEKNIDKGFEKVKSLKENLHAVYNTDPESIKLLETEEIAVAGWGVLPNVYRHLGPESKYTFVMPAPRFLATIPVSIVKGRGEAKQAAAEKLVNYMLKPESQTVMTSIAGTIPANPEAEVPEKLKTVIPELPIQDVYDVDWSVVNKNYSEWEDRWAREIQSR